MTCWDISPTCNFASALVTVLAVTSRCVCVRSLNPLAVILRS